MSIMTDARLRLLEARVAEIERRLAGPTAKRAAEVAGPAAPPGKAGAERRGRTEKAGKQARKSR